jgi:predicted kinase
MLIALSGILGVGTTVAGELTRVLPAVHLRVIIARR